MSSGTEIRGSIWGQEILPRFEHLSASAQRHPELGGRVRRTRSLYLESHWPMIETCGQLSMNYGLFWGIVAQLLLIMVASMIEDCMNTTWLISLS